MDEREIYSFTIIKYIDGSVFAMTPQRYTPSVGDGENTGTYADMNSGFQNRLDRAQALIKKAGELQAKGWKVRIYVGVKPREQGIAIQQRLYCIPPKNI